MAEQSIEDWFMEEVLPLEPVLTRFLKRCWPNAAGIDDLRQEAYARVFEEASRERPIMVKPFVLQITRKLMIDRLAQQEMAGPETVAEFLSRDREPAESRMTAAHELLLLQNDLGVLPPSCRRVVWMRKVEKLSQKEIAERMGVPMEVVESLIASGIRFLMQARWKASG